MNPIPTKTMFCSTTVEICGRELFIDGNSKVTATGGSMAEPIPNAFGLPAVATCPGSTAVCRSTCYVAGLEKHAPDLAMAYRRNLAALLWILDNCAATAAAELGDWIEANCPDFRWHVSGDVISRSHARWIVDVVAHSPGTRHWIYTRTLDAVPILQDQYDDCDGAAMYYDHAGDRPMAVNVSADRENYAAARAVAAAYGARVCYLDQGEGPPADLPEGSVIFPDYPQRGNAEKRTALGLPVLLDPTDHPWWQARTHAERRMVCPADFFGQAEEYRCGVCTKCMVPA